MKRWKPLEKRFPGLTAAMAVVSCEEAVEDVREYVSAGPSPERVVGAEKEHIMICVQITVDGRAGVLLADPGYHVPRLLTIMMDRAYPHTGWFTHTDTEACRKEYHYSFNMINSGYVEWYERETRPNCSGTITNGTISGTITNGTISGTITNGTISGTGGTVTVKCQSSLVYVARPYLDCVNVTERRNLVYNFRSLLARDQKGQVVAGVYFPVGGGRDAQFTLFRHPNQLKLHCKFSHFDNPEQVPEAIASEIKQCNALMNYKEGELHSIISRLSKVMADASYIDQMLAINDEICRYYCLN